MIKETPYNPPVRRYQNAPAIKWKVLLLSLVVHVGLLATLGFFSGQTVEIPKVNMKINISQVPLQTSDLPPLAGSKEAGPTREAPRQQPEAKPEVKAESPEPVVKKAEPEVKKPEVKPEVKKPEVKKTEVKKDPVEEKVITTRPKEVEKEKEPEPEPEVKKPSPGEVARSLEARRDVFTSSQDVRGGGKISRYIASGGDTISGGGGPDLYRSVLVGLIGGYWDPPLTRLGDVKDATIAFTVYSPPLARDAVNQVRKARIMDIRILISSGDLDFDTRALEAVRAVLTWPPLPNSYRKDTLEVTCRFYLIGED